MGDTGNERAILSHSPEMYAQLYWGTNFQQVRYKAYLYQLYDDGTYHYTGAYRGWVYGYATEFGSSWKYGMKDFEFRYLPKNSTYHVKVQMQWRYSNGVWGSDHTHWVPGFANWSSYYNKNQDTAYCTIMP